MLLAAGCGAKTGLLVCHVELDEYERSTAPRPLAPWSTGTVTTHQPTFRWVPAPDAIGARLTLCRDRDCRAPVFTLDVRDDHVRAPQPLALGPWFWQLRDLTSEGPGCRVGPVWEFFVTPLDTAVDTSWHPRLDVNRDGVDDLALDSGGTVGVQVFHGGPAGLPATPSATWTATTIRDTGVQNAGDVNGDGYADLLVKLGEDHWDLHLGGRDGVSATVFGSMDFVVAVHTAGDVDGDGYADVVTAGGVQQGLYRGSPTGLSRAPALLNGSVCALGGIDMNGDGLGDVVWCDPDDGFVQVYLGDAAARLSQSRRVDEPMRDGVRRRTAAIDAGDVDGDGYADVLVHGGAVYENLPPVLWAVRGGPSPVQFVGQAWQPTDGVDGLTSGAGVDVNGDGLGDVVLLHQTSDHRGETLSLYTGAPAGLTASPTSSIALPMIEPAGASQALEAADLDGDGRGDVVLGGHAAPGAPQLWIYPAGRAPATTLPVAGPNLVWNSTGPSLAD